MKGNRLWFLGTVAIIAIVVVLGWFLGISPKLAEGDLAQAQIADVNAQNAVQQAMLAQLKGQYDNLDQLRLDLAEIRKEIPSIQPADDFIDWVNSAATTATVAVTKITIGEAGLYAVPTAIEGAPTTTEDVTPSGPAAPDGVYTIPVSIEVTGSAANVINFSKLMQLGTRLFVSPSFSFTPEKSAGLLQGFLYLVDDPSGSAFPVPEPSASPTETPAPAPTEEPTASPTPTATEG